MKWIPEQRILELTSRNIEALLDKLDDPASHRTLQSPCRQVAVHSVELRDADAVEAAAGQQHVVTVTRSDLENLSMGQSISTGSVRVKPVRDSAHYCDRPSGPIYMPTEKKWR